MKFALIAFALLAAVSAAPTRTLEDDLRDILAVIPVDEIRAIISSYIETDAEGQEVVAYLQGEEWAALVETVANNEVWIEFKEFMLERGVDVDYIVQLIHDIIASARKSTKSVPVPRSLRDMIDEILAILPTEELLLVLNDKLRNSEDFQELWAEISSAEAYAFVEQIRALEEVQRLAQELRDRGIDVDYVLNIVYGLLGWN